ncbi:nitroreductase family protein [Pseudonocardia sp.]|uniref:nitroreductase family protein n=1 Tax=Pseudonocardia sp. TaxID=60912 RepID=UPI003D0AD00B
MTELLPLDPDQLLTTTRSVRKRLDLERPVPLEIVKECLEVALQAPSGSNRQDWHWIVLTDPDLRRKVSELYARSFDAYRNSPGYGGFDPKHDDARQAVQTRVAGSAEYLAEHMAEAPVLVIGAIYSSVPLSQDNQAGTWGSLLPAAWSLQLALRARGLGSAWTTLHLAYEKEVAELLGIPERVRQGVLLPVAWTKGTDFKPAPRQPLEKVLHVDGW